MEPLFLNHQIMGSSMMVRFAKVVLHKAARRNSANGALQIGLCVSGQKAAQLLRRLRSVLLNSRPLLDNILLMIGVNDFLQGTRLCILKMRLLKIVKLLSSHQKNVVILTVPPIPKLSMEDHVKLLRYNKFVIKMGERNAVRVLDIYGLFLQEDETINLDLFERFIGAPKKKKVDMVHWNKKGMKLVEDHLKRHL